MYSNSFRILCNNILTNGRGRYNLTLGIVSRIKDDRYWIVSVSSDTNAFVVGEDFPLRQTYCRDVYLKKKTIALTEIDGTPGLQKHPLYQAMTLEAYISTPILVNNDVWGTVNFSCLDFRKEKFSDEDIDFIEGAAERISNEIMKA